MIPYYVEATITYLQKHVTNRINRVSKIRVKKSNVAYNLILLLTSFLTDIHVLDMVWIVDHGHKEEGAHPGIVV